MKRPINIIVACCLAAVAFYSLRCKLRSDEDAELIKIAIPLTPLVQRNPGNKFRSELYADNHAIVRTTDNRAEVYFFATKTAQYGDTKVTLVRDSKGAWHADLGPGTSY